MPELTITILPETIITDYLPSAVNLLVNYTKEIPSYTTSEEETSLGSGQRILPLSRTINGEVNIEGYSDSTLVQLTIIDSKGSLLLGPEKFNPVKIAREIRFTLDWTIPNAEIELIRKKITPKAPKSITSLVRSARFMTIGFTMPNFRNYSLLVSPVRSMDFDEDLLSGLFQIQEFQTISRRLTKELLPRLSELPLNSVSMINVGLNGRFNFTTQIAEEERDREDAWIWILSGREVFVGLLKEKDIGPSRKEITIILSAPAKRSSEEEREEDVFAEDVDLPNESELSVENIRTDAPLDVSEDELLSKPELFSDDPGSYCKPFTNPNRIVSERVFNTILRVEQPDIGGRTSVPPDEGRPPYNPVRPAAPVSMGVTEREGAPPGPIIFSAPISSGGFLGIAPQNLRVANVNTELATKAAIDQRRQWTLSKSRGRYLLDGNDALDWEGDSFPYQATTLSFGHILEFRVRWRSNGYSHGKVAHTLTLAPRQTRRITTVQSQILDKTKREESTQSGDRINQTTDRDYTYQDAVESNLKEWAQGHSSSSTKGVAGGAGLVLPGFAIGGGAAHGSSQSDSWQKGGRNVSANEQQSLRDSIRQYGESLRKLESLVVVEQSQEEIIQGVSEIVRNPNYGHSLTIIYHEILRHLRIDTEVVGARECIFVPFALKPFTYNRVLRWRDILESNLKKSRLRWVVQYLQDLNANGDYVGFSVPPGSRAEHPIKFLSGSLYLKLSIERPRNGEAGAFSEESWEPLIPFLPLPPLSIWSSLNQLDEAQRDLVFQKKYAGSIAAQWADTLEFKDANLDDADFTMATSYGFNRTVRVNFSCNIDDESFTRKKLQNIGVKAAKSLSAKSIVNLTKVRVHYYTESFNKQVVSNERADDLINIENGVPTGTGADFFIPLTNWEKTDLRSEISSAASELVTHLNEHGEYYHKIIWWSMDRDKLFMMLDSIYISLEDKRSVASVVQREPVGVIGNSLVYSVAGGAHIGVDGIKSPEELNDHYRDSSIKSEPMRVSLPTSGLYAQAIIDDCEALEEHFGSTDWVLNDIEPELSQIAPELLQSRRSNQADVTPTDFPASIINLQNAANPPAPSGLSDVLSAVQNANAFRDMAGLAGTQANARAAMETAAGLANQFGSKAVDLKKTELAAKIANEKLNIIKKAAKNKMIDKASEMELSKKTLEEMNMIEKEPLSTDEIKEIAKTSDDNKVDIEVNKLSGKAKIQSNKNNKTTNKKTISGDVIDFSDERTLIVERDIEDQIQEYFKALKIKFLQSLDSSDTALDNFTDTVVINTPTDEAQADILGAMLGEVFGSLLRSSFKQAGKVYGKTPGAFAAGVAIDLFNAAQEEMEKAGKVEASNILGNWIKSQRDSIGFQRSDFTKAEAEGKIVEDMTLKYFEAEDKEGFMVELFEVTEILRKQDLPSHQDFERDLYVQWINAHFKKIGKDTDGCIELLVEDDSHGLKLITLKIDAPEGGKIGDALNRIGAKTWDLKVRKRICFDMENLVGGTSVQCGWLDKNNVVIHTPPNPAAADKFEGVNLGSLIANSGTHRFFDNN